MIEFEFRPLESPPINRSRKDARFRSSHKETLQLLDSELRHLKASQVVIQAHLDPHQIRLDGMMRSDARPRSPAIVLSFNSTHGPLSYPCDTYDDWKDNLRAIALSLQSLRAVDRYGVTKRSEQYRGWAKLPGPSNVESTEINSLAEARAFIHCILGTNWPIDWKEPYQSNAILRAKGKTHPDHGGDAEQFKKVMRAEEVIRNHAKK